MSDINSTAHIELTANGQQPEEALKRLKTRVEDLRDGIAKAAKEGDKVTMKKLQKELKDTRRQIQQIEADTKGVDAVMRRLDSASPKELRDTLKQLNRQLQSIERGSKAWDEQVAKIRRVQEELDSINSELRRSEGFWDRMNRRMNDWRTSLMSGVAALSGLVMGARKAYEVYAEMDAEMANVRKFTGMTAEEVASLNEEFKKMDTRTSRQELNQLASEAGRLGKTSQEDILGFVRAANQINVALDDLGEGATLTLSKLTGIFGDEERLGTEQSLLAVGSVINTLSQNCSASAPYLAEFASRMGGVGAQAGMTISQIMGFAAVLDSNQQQVESAATALSQVLTRLYQNPAKYAKAAGLDVKAFSDLLKSDANSALITLLEQLNSLGNMDVLAPIFKDMGEKGSRSVAALSTLAKEIDAVKTQQQVATEAFAEATSVTEEYNVQNNTVQAGLDKARKRANELVVTLGEKLAPVMHAAIASGNAMMKVLTVIIDFLAKYWKELAVVATAIAAYNVAVNFAIIKTKALAVAQGVVTAATAAWRAAVLLASAATALLSGNVTRATAAFKLFSAALKLSPIGLVVTAITAVVGGLTLWASNARKAAKEQNVLNAQQKKFDEIEKRAHESVSRQLTDLKLLYESTQNQTLAMEERLKAVKKLQEQYPEHFKNLTDEEILVGKAKAAYDRLTKSLLNSARAEARRDEIAKIETEIITLERKFGRLSKGATAYRDSLQKEGLVDEDGNLIDASTGQPNVAIRRKILKGGANASEPFKQLRDLQRKLAEEIVALESDVVVGSGIGGDDDDTDSKNKFQAEDDWRATEEAKNRIAYAIGEKDYDAYTKRMLAIAVEYQSKKLKHTDLSEKERLEIEAAYQQAMADMSSGLTKLNLEEETAAHNESMAALKQRFIDGELTTEQYNNAAELLNLEHLRQMVLLTEKGSKERLEAEAKYRDALFKDQQARHAATEKAEAEHQKELARIKKEVFGNTPEENKSLYDADLNNLDIVYEAQLKAAGNNAAEKLRIEEAYQKAKLALQKKYNQEADADTRNGMQKAVASSLEWLNGEGGQALKGTMDTVVSGMSSIFSQLSSLMQAELAIQTSAIEKRYDAEISRAEGNTYKIKKLEAQKEKEIAKVKNEANRKMFAMQVIQAVAQTATNALSAYGSAAAVPIVGYILAPIAAAMAVAAGAIQIASIKKQQQASEAQGYSQGGFTPEGGVNTPVGIVHAGEWVASQKLTHNPATRPFLEALDYAQRTNTIGSFRTSDMAAIATRTVSATPDDKAAAAMMVSAGATHDLSVVVSRLNERLNEPFVTVNTVTGDTGIKKAQDEYERLMRNKTPKSKRKN